MKINTTYTCEYCGKAFDDINECLLHERKELEKQVDNKVMYFDCDGKRLPIDASPNLIDYFWVADEVAFNYVNVYFSECGFSRPRLDTSRCEGGFYYENDLWQNVEELREHLNEIEKIFKDCE